MRRNLLWLGILLVVAALGVGLLNPRPKGPWQYEGIGLGHSFLPDDGRTLCYRSDTIDVATGNNCEFAAFQDRDPGLHVRFYQDRAILIWAPHLTRGKTRLKLGMKQKEILALLGKPTRQILQHLQVLVYEEDASLLAVLLESDSVVSLQTMSKFQCSNPRGECAYYWGWWEDYLATEAMEMATYDKSWPWSRARH